jgi:cardiolipin synthase
MKPRRYRDRFDTERILNFANIITAARIVLIPFFAQCIIQGKYPAAFTFFVICGLTDALDGFIARIFSVKSKFGMLLDPIADKALMATSFIILGIYHKIPPWLVVITISRDIIILTGSLIIIIFIGIEGIYTVSSSRVNTVLQVITIGYILLLLAVPSILSRVGLSKYGVFLKVGLIYATGFTTCVSGIQYFIRGFKTLTRL